MVRVLYVARSRNDKTGNVPTAWIGGTRKESLDSCRAVKCPLLSKREGGKGGDGNAMCYAQHGTASFAHHSMIKSGKDHGPEQAITRRHKGAKMVRLGAIGDPSMADRGTLMQFVALAREAGLSVVGYTHGWRRRFARDLKGVCMASCDTLEGADQALDAGWRAAVVLDASHTGRTFETPKGRRGIVCPAIASKASKAGKAVQCNDCRLCDPSRKGPIIGFPDHGPGSIGRTMGQAASPMPIAHRD